MPTDEDLVKAAMMDSEPPEEKEEKSTPEPEPKPEEKIEAPEPEKKEEAPAENLDEKPEKVEAKVEEPEKKPTRKERREERKKSLIESSRRDNTQPKELPKTQPHQPLDYNKSEQFEVEDLEKDRKAYGEQAFLEATKLEREVAEQEKFWSSMDYESRILTSNPEFAWLDDKNSDAFDPDRAETVNELYLEMIGYKEIPVVDPRTNMQIVDPNTGKPAFRATVARTDISYEKFVKNLVGTMKSWAEDEIETSRNNLVEQRDNAGVRPSGGARKTLGDLKPGDISKMSDEDLEKYSDEIDRQILSLLD